MLIKKKFLLKKCSSSSYNVIKNLILNINNYKCKYDYLAITHRYKDSRIFTDNFAIDLKTVLSFIKSPEISIINIIPKKLLIMLVKKD